jgi:hypothetical protein
LEEDKACSAINTTRLARDLAALERIVGTKYQRGDAASRQHSFVEVLFSDITESREVLNLSELVRKPLPPGFQQLY